MHPAPSIEVEAQEASKKKEAEKMAKAAQWEADETNVSYRAAIREFKHSHTAFTFTQIQGYFVKSWHACIHTHT